MPLILETWRYLSILQISNIAAKCHLGLTLKWKAKLNSHLCAPHSNICFVLILHNWRSYSHFSAKVTWWPHNLDIWPVIPKVCIPEIVSLYVHIFHKSFLLIWALVKWYVVIFFAIYFYRHHQQWGLSLVVKSDNTDLTSRGRGTHYFAQYCTCMTKIPCKVNKRLWYMNIFPRIVFRLNQW